MNPNDFRKKMGGVIAFPVTPFKGDLSLDVPGYRRNLQGLVKHPLCAIVAAGGTGELYSLTPAEHLEIVKATVEEVKGRCPVIAGVGFNRAIAIELARQSEKAGADAILALPPYYPGADDDALLEYYAGIGGATPLDPTSPDPGDDLAAGRSPLLDRRGGGRQRAGLLLDRDPDLHVEHRDGGAAPVDRAARGGGAGGRGDSRETHARLRRATLWSKIAPEGL